jgi:hypothetical protein
VPERRGPLTDWLFDLLTGRRPGPEPTPTDDPLVGDDFHLALYSCYELSYRGFAGVTPDMEWDLRVLAFRRRLEDTFERALRDEAEVGPADPVEDARVAVEHLLGAFDGPSLSTFMADCSTSRQFHEFLVHRSAYQLKEADPHSWAIPRLVPGARKAALIEIQADEYGGGRPGAAHAELFAGAMAAAGLDDTYGAYLRALPGSTLATSNLISLFGLHRRLAGALLGHLAVFEMTSVGPMGRYVQACRRHRLPDEAARFYAVHVEADVHHGQLAATRLLGGDLRADGLDPAELVFGARSLLAVEDRFARSLLDAWAVERSSLLPPAGRTARSGGRRSAGGGRSVTPSV